MFFSAGVNVFSSTQMSVSSLAKSERTFVGPRPNCSLNSPTMALETSFSIDPCRAAAVSCSTPVEASRVHSVESSQGHRVMVGATAVIPTPPRPADKLGLDGFLGLLLGALAQLLGLLGALLARRLGGRLRGLLDHGLAALDRLLPRLTCLLLGLVGDPPIRSSSIRVEGITMPARKPMATPPMASPMGFSWATPPLAGRRPSPDPCWERRR